MRLPNSTGHPKALWPLFSIGPQKPIAVNTDETGQSSPLGATIVPGGVNFSLFSRSASGVKLLLFDREDDAEPGRIIHFDLLPISLITTGTRLSPAYNRGSFTVTACGDLHIAFATLEPTRRSVPARPTFNESAVRRPRDGH
jgi:hypothetical protein